MAESEVNKRIREAYEESGGSKKQVHELVNAGKEKGDKNKVSIGQVRQWFLENTHMLKKGEHLTPTLRPSPNARYKLTRYNTNTSSPTGIEFNLSSLKEDRG